jgi:hypothetical protein
MPLTELVILSPSDGHPAATGSHAPPTINAEPLHLLCAMLGSEPQQALIRLMLADAVVLDDIVHLASREQLSSTLHEAVAAHFAAEFPKAQRMVLALHHETNRRRNAAIRNALLEIGHAAHHRGFDVLALKCSKWILEDADKLAAWRESVDVDVLVEPEHFDAMLPLLAELGYRDATKQRGLFARMRGPRVEYSLAAHSRADVPVPLEVHRHIGWRPTILPTELMFTGRRIVAPGLAVAQSWCAAFHAMVHWQQHHNGLRQFSSDLQTAFEVARFLRRNDVDLERLARHAASVGMQREVQAAAVFATELFAARTPAAFQPSPYARRYLARCLAIRKSPARAWIASRRARVLRMWDCKRTVYRAYVEGVAPERARATLWIKRIIRLPMMLWIGLYSVVVGAGKLLAEAALGVRGAAG